METTKKQTFITYDEALEIITPGKPKHYIVTKEGEEPTTMRLFNNQGQLGFLPKRARTRGYAFRLYGVTSIVPVPSKEKELTFREELINTHKKIRNLIVKETHPNLWQDLVKAQKALTDEELEKVADLAETHEEGLTSFTFWKAMGELHLGARLDGKYKRLSVRGTLPKYGDREARIAKFAQAIEDSKNKPDDWSFRDFWRTSYDYSVSIKNGRAWLNEEYKGYGNGHYYLLLNANTAIFCEDD